MDIDIYRERERAPTPASRVGFDVGHPRGVINADLSKLPYPDRASCICSLLASLFFWFVVVVVGIFP